MIVYTSLAVFLFCALALVLPSGFSLGAAMLLLGAVALLHPAARRARLERDDWLMVAALLVYFAVHVVDNLAHHAALAEYDAPLRLLLAVPVLLLLRSYPPRGWALWSGAAAGAIGAGVLSLWQLTVLDVPRPSGSTNPIQYGNISLILAMLCGCALLWAISQRRGPGWLSLLLAGAVLGALAGLLSGSRGSWLALPLWLIATVTLALRQQQALLAGKIVVGAGLAVTLLWSWPHSGLRARTEVALNEADLYRQRNDGDSSIGARLEMLRVGSLMAPQHLLLGWGKQGMFDHKASLVDSGQAAPSIRAHTHLHNEALDALVKRGVPGLLALLLLTLAPLAAFARAWAVQGTSARPYALAGMLLMLSYLAFGLTQAFLTHNNGVMILAFLSAMLWGLARRSPAPGAAP